MKVLVIGSGGREHAIVDALAHSPHVKEIYAAPGNGGIQSQASLVPIAADDVKALAVFARGSRMDLTFVGPEVPLSLGVVDTFRQDGLTIVGPTAEQARLESSKSFAKQFFKAHGIPTAEFQECSSPDKAFAVLERVDYPIVVKADGLAAGKGVVVAEDVNTARAAVRDFMEGRTLGDAGARLVIEEFLTGHEVSLHAFADGAAFQPMAPAQDHKRRFDDDEGPNTGGMGAYSIDSMLSSAERDEIVAKMIRPTLENADGFSGILFAGLMMTAKGPRLLEYNARFGDPETQVILPRLKTDFAEILVDITQHRLASRTLEWSQDVTVAVVLVARGYPGKVETGKQIRGLQEASDLEGVKIYHAGTRAENGNIYTAGGRVLSVVGRGTTLASALERAYAAAEMIEFDGKDYRRDIGRKGMTKQK